MGIKFGEIDARQIIENEITTKFLMKLVIKIITSNAIKGVNQKQIDQMLEEAINEVRTKYPKSVRQTDEWRGKKFPSRTVQQTLQRTCPINKKSN